jgi:predicted unusual protein kinase regulating ubiquinone biosynthesis (AarF/ABC1/UbiB family)
MYNYFITNILLFYIIIKESISYKLSLISFNDAVINVCEQIVHLNVLYAKMVQWSVQDYFRVDDDLKKYFYKFNSNVPYNDNDIDYNLISNIETNFKDKLIFDKKPINSGTVALIFKGDLNGKMVAIKILKKNMLERISNGIENIKLLTFIIAKLLLFFSKINLNPNFLISNNKTLLLQQCDLLQEVNNIEKFRVKHISNKKIVIPNVCMEFTEFNNNIIVMDYLDGHNINDVNKEFLLPYADTIKSFVLNSYLVFKEIHADMHAGNIILLKDDKVGLIDFGLTIEITSKQSNDIFNVFLSLTTTNIELLQKSIINIVLNNNADNEKNKYIWQEPFALIKDDIISNKKISTNNIIKTLQLLINNIDGNKNINQKASCIFLSIISCIHILDTLDFDKKGFGFILSKHLGVKDFFK